MVAPPDSAAGPRPTPSSPLDQSQVDLLRSLDDGAGAVLIEIVNHYLADVAEARGELAARARPRRRPRPGARRSQGEGGQLERRCDRTGGAVRGPGGARSLGPALRHRWALGTLRR